jgi:chromate transporter
MVRLRADKVAPMEPTEAGTEHGVSFGEAARFWIKLGFINFGGPAGQISLMHEELVERRRWISQGRFLHALNFCMLLPGPEAQQLAIYIGWLLHKVRGGILAGVAFILPAFFLIWGLSWTYAAHGDVPVIQGLFAGLQAAVVGIVAVAVVRIGEKALTSPARIAIAAGAFVALFVGHVLFPVIIVVAAAIGLTGVAGGSPPAADDPQGDVALPDHAALPPHTQPSTRRALVTLAVGLAVWIVPLWLLVSRAWVPPVLGQQAVFFSKAALVTFGGAYAVLSYINQAAIAFGWVTAGEVATGLGLAESTPGPLIMVTEFVGFLGAYQNPGTMSPAAAGALGALVVTWATFAPCFLWIFLGGPYVEVLRANRRLASALAAVTAAVVGIVLNLAVTLAFTTLFERLRGVEVFGNVVLVPAPGTLDVFATLIAVASAIALWRFKVHVLWVVGVAAALGIARAVLGA